MRIPTAIALLVPLLFAGIHSEAADKQADKKSEKAPKYDITVDTSDVPEMDAYGKKVKLLMDEWYPKLIAALPSENFKPLHHVVITIKKRNDGVAEAGDGKITATAQWFKERPDDIGAFVHELTHVVQSYGGGDHPGWLVEGIADYVRWFEFEPVSKRPRPNPEKAKYDDSYQTTAHFLNYVQNKYDKKLVVKLNAACREGVYNDSLWKDYTKKSLEELGTEWKKSLGVKTKE